MTDTLHAAPVEVTRELLVRYDRPGPRYTSYPTAPEWREDFGDADYRAALAEAATRPGEPLSLYVHIPFCHERCAFCGCNVVIAKKAGVAETYLGYVERELTMAAEALNGRNVLKQLHWGGGTPTYLDIPQIRRLYGTIARLFTIDPTAEVALEVDPRVTTRGQIETLRELGFNRISMGVQDFDPEVQCEIHRNQTEAEARQLCGWAREAGFEGINIDLVYGLPKQNPEGWARTIESILDVRPDRLAIYSYAHLPEKLRNQRRIDASVLPTGHDKYELFALARRILVGGGYRAIGMDHFALPSDELALAMDERRLHRNFMGYTVVPASEMLGIGASAIGEIGGCYAQNDKKLSGYEDAIEGGKFATHSGAVLTQDDVVRRWVIRQIMCNFYLDTAALRAKFGVEYGEYFAQEDQALNEFVEQNFVARDNGNIQVLPLGQIFIRNVAMLFDAYIKRPAGFKMFSRTV